MLIMYFIYNLSFNCDGEMVKQLITFVHLYFCNNITLKMAIITAET
jgi:hypothetical protein